MGDLGETLVIENIGDLLDHGFYTLRQWQEFRYKDQLETLLKSDIGDSQFCDVKVYLIDECRGLSENETPPAHFISTIEDAPLYLYTIIGQDKQTYDFDDFPDNISHDGYDTCGNRTHQLFDLDQPE